eukprot:CAMPEP_0114373292 /NCGR_PEP_ID=MMETSP0101-20121206/34763_1 /TAXON_ID=38822 ORGANISM="Pteridomonas danica, Strain PT" /NCGR_SAMPLE_ID=MMETSP0101 /ASSEMBLY_ACC=CAM_ASM_000211 /LENGTH=49 /DNA_ID= /DNA_START= /DNA_END= /DNA_ORIENTATION=
MRREKKQDGEGFKQSLLQRVQPELRALCEREARLDPLEVEKYQMTPLLS